MDHIEETFSSTCTRKLGVRRTIFRGRSEFQEVEILDTFDYGVTLFLDGRFQTSERAEFFYHEALVHPAMASHPGPRDVLIVGGGDGGTLEEVAKYRSVRSIRMVELDGKVVEIARRWLREICGDAFEDPRLELVIDDGRRFVERTPERFDVILLDLTDPIEEAKYVYTREFYALCRERLREGGVLASHANSPFLYPETFNVVTKTLASAFPALRTYVTYTPGYMMDFAFALCGRDRAPVADPGAVAERLRREGIADLRLYGPEMHAALFAVPGYVREILARPCRLSTDADPYILDEEEL